jgi:putative transcriptional regulator
MSNHPNRGKNPVNPKPEQIAKARHRAGLTQKDAAELVHSSERAWQQWEGAQRTMPGAVWELFRLKTGELELTEPKA